MHEANRRYEIIRPFLHDAPVMAPSRTVYRWLARYRHAERLYGNGYVGLLPRTRDRGNRRRTLPEATRELMTHAIR